MTTLPGVNNQLRLYARLQSTTGYVLRTNQTSGAERSGSSASTAASLGS